MIFSIDTSFPSTIDGINSEPKSIIGETVAQDGYNLPYVGVGKPALYSGVSNWSVALLQSDDPNHNIEFHLMGTYKEDVSSRATQEKRPTINGLQIVPVETFLQPAVTTSDGSDPLPIEYGPLERGVYLLLQITGAVDMNTHQPTWAGGWYRLLYSTDKTDDNQNPPSLLRLNFPETNRYTTGAAASADFAGKGYYFNHAGGYITLGFDDIVGHYENKVQEAERVDAPLIAHGSAYPPTGDRTPLAPIFALINMSTLAANNENTNPVIFNPSSGAMTISGTLCSMYSTTYGASIYYTKTQTNDSTEPLPPEEPVINSDGTPGTNTYLYSTPFAISKNTKLKACAVTRNLADSPVSSIYYFFGTSTGATAVCDPPIFNPPSGEHGGNLLVSISSATPNARIYYTLSERYDDSEPNNPAMPQFNADGSAKTGTYLYTAPITVTRNTKFNAIAVKQGLLDSPVATAYYYTHYVY